MRRLVAIHVLPAMRLVLPAFVCSVGNRVVAMAVSLLGSRCSFIASPINSHSDNPHGQGLPFASRLVTCAHRQELQRTLPGALAASFYDEAGMIGVGALPVGQSPVWCV